MRIGWTICAKRPARVLLVGLALLGVAQPGLARRRHPPRPPVPAPVAPPPPVVELEEPPPAPLDEGVIFREHYEQAVKHYGAQEYEKAIGEFQAAYNCKPVPRLLFNIAQAHRKQEHLAEALFYFNRYIQSDETMGPEVRAEVAAYKAELQAKQLALETAMAPPKVIVISTEKPPPRYYRPLGITASVIGLGALGVGAAFLGLNGRCSDTPTGLALECDRLYNSFTPGVALTAIGGSATVIGAVFVGLSLRRPKVTREIVSSPSQPGKGASDAK